MAWVWNSCAPGTKRKSEHADFRRVHNVLCIECLKIFTLLNEFQFFLRIAEIVAMKVQSQRQSPVPPT